jgi:hypothetical protein
VRSRSLFVFFSSWSSSSSSSSSSFVVIFYEGSGRIFCDFLSLLEKSIGRFIFIFLVKKDVLNALYKAHRNTQRRRRIRKQRAPLPARELYIFLKYIISKKKQKIKKKWRRRLRI